MGIEERIAFLEEAVQHLHVHKWVQGKTYATGWYVGRERLDKDCICGASDACANQQEYDSLPASWQKEW